MNQQKMEIQFGAGATSGDDTTIIPNPASCVIIYIYSISIIIWLNIKLDTSLISVIDFLSFE